jgi:hypothetical protein
VRERELSDLSQTAANDLLFILGAGKTGTTSLCGLLNCHPDIFVMCEVDFNRTHISRYGTKLLRAHQHLLPCFFRPYGSDFLTNYERAHEMMRARGHAAKYFGDKLVGIDSGYVDDYRDSRVIYSVRRLPEWIAKDSVRAWFPLERDIVPFAVQYTKHFVESFLLPRVLHIRLDDFLHRNAQVVHDVWRFLEVDPPANAERWWETVGNYPETDPKAALNWWRGHASAAVAPQENDTEVAIKPSPFWQELLPIFDKYYDGLDTRRFEPAEIAADLVQLQGMIGRHCYPFASSFVKVRSRSHNFRLKSKRFKGFRYYILRFRRKIRKKWTSALLQWG